jgi:hypothetical protein
MRAIVDAERARKIWKQILAIAGAYILAIV